MEKLISLKLLGAIAIVGATSAFGTGCMMPAHASASGEAEAPVTYASRPTLVAVSSGVWVVRSSAHATYYVSDSYWCYRDGTWYRSGTYDGGWAVVSVSVVPTVIVKSNHSLYVNYEGGAAAVTKPAPGGGGGHDYVATNDPPPSKKEKEKDKDDLPGVGNKRKDAGEQPGQVGKGLVKDSPNGKSDKKDDHHDHPGKKDDHPGKKKK
jgi:hypothetical protein